MARRLVDGFSEEGVFVGLIEAIGGALLVCAIILWILFLIIEAMT